MLIGWASVDVTPARPVNLHGQFHVRISQFVSDPLTATALAFDSVGADGAPEQAIMISCDRVYLPSEIHQRVCTALAPLLPDFDTSKLFFCSTHTHTAPDITSGFYPPQGPEVTTPEEYAAFFIERTVDAAVRAWQARAEGGITTGLGHAVVGLNRRITYADGSSVMYGSTNREDFECVEGYEDHSVGLIFTWDAAQKLTGMIVNIACPSQVVEGESFVSADFWHETRVELRRRFGDDLFVRPQCSAAGDQSPHPQWYQAAEAAMRERRGLTEREEIARRIVNTVGETLEVCSQGICTAPTFRHVVRTLELTARAVTQQEYDGAAAELAQLERDAPGLTESNAISYNWVMRWLCRDVMSRFEEQRETLIKPVDVHAMRLGDIAICTNPFELFLDYGMRMKARSKAQQTFVIQLTSSAIGCRGAYLPTARAVAAASYGAMIADNIFGPEAGQALVEGTVAMINEMWESA